MNLILLLLFKANEYIETASKQKEKNTTTKWQTVIIFRVVQIVLTLYVDHTLNSLNFPNTCCCCYCRRSVDRRSIVAL